MNDNINIAELLKDSPKGTKLYSTIFGEVELKEVKDNGRSVCILVTNFYGQEEMFYPDGKYNTHYSDSECTLFPSKEQRDWSKFCPFKDGDVLSDNYSVFIFKSRMFDRGLDSHVYKSHCVLAPNKRLAVKPGGYNHAAGVVSFATEEEKEKLFEAIKENGYKWNAETKTLDMETNKFDIATLKPFDKVLMRDFDTQEWFISLFSHHNGLKMYKYSCINGRGYAQCVPFEGNEHLLGTTNDCNDFYKTCRDETDE